MRSFAEKTRVKERNKSNDRAIADKLVKGTLYEEVMWRSGKPERASFYESKNFL